MKELLFYTVDKDYIKYLSEFETHVSYNKEEIGHSRPYLGIVLTIEDYEYFVPLYSYKEHYSKYKNNPSFFFVYDKNSKQDKKYQDLISTEYRYINANKEEIYKRANKMYIAVTKHKNDFFKSIACDFKLLEKKCLEYIEN